ncbi:MAG: oligosaccharide flippase family protein [Gemmatimonas sp.]
MALPSAKRIAVANTVGYGIALAVSFVQAPFLIRLLGDERYGLWSLVGLITGYYGLLDFGTRGAVGYFVSRARARNDAQETAETTASAFWFLVAAALLVLLVGLVGLWSFPGLFGVPSGMLAQTRAAFAIALVTMALSLPLDVFPAVVNGCRRAEIVALSETVVRVMTMVAIFAVLPSYNRLDMLAMANLAGRVMVWGVAALTAHRLDLNWSVRPRFLRLARLREIVRYGLQSFVGNVAGTFVERLDSLVIAISMGPQMVTYYVIGQSLVNYLRQGVNAITLALTPFFADLNARRQDDRTLELFLGGTRAATLVTGLIAGGLLAFAPDFLTLWVGPQYVSGEWTRRSDVVLLVLLTAMIPRFILSAGHQYLFGTNQQGYLSRVVVVEGVANLALSLLLVGPLGLAGVAIGSAIPSLVSHGWFAPRFMARALGIHVRRIVIEGQLPGLLCGVVVTVVGMLLARVSRPITWGALAIDVGLTLLIAAPIVWQVGLTNADREMLRQATRRRRIATS